MSSKMLNNILGIDTSHEETVIGLNGKLVVWKSVRNQSKELLPKIDKLLQEQKIKPAKLKGVAVNIGPGSFTGLRVGVTVANGFGYGLKLPVAGISEFDVVKMLYPKVDIIVLDAKRGELFIQASKTAPKLIPAGKLGGLIKTGTRVYLDDYRLVPATHEQLKKAGTIYIPNLTRSQKMTAMLTAKLPKKFAQVLPVYLRGANITKSKKK
ncbi:TPA: tRNA (adenosine(37)-N6)-threonylcarbamoyltransferase complex dimerization subunit type 1 TsaB [Patescibacteria group bacterium]|uniref:Glycoprotease family protein n=2 Tax=Bacteria division Kazan-3B-28 TaxID=1798534 RepID=A0A0G4BCV8_UNCK3|nr:MAG: glycoprotease family protein [candidate division Kazan bacterium GW2011_GWA1_50_15]HCL47429.1 tRNA (adenosine(37)-N6)-threonylcarbamoyltransferase complex dimerization subunit type 1 TsaB [Patescibacteria group bacterium]HCR42425.1 tRNA (adenosine(37)-N6)-threonylcarbamoyltransferase complex dimerization subunit type 1 TsaB [Patescibacteria group bacterium]